MYVDASTLHAYVTKRFLVYGFLFLEKTQRRNICNDEIMKGSM
jgi:hypothetical protein